MKPLIITFFMIILGYSLFIDKSDEKQDVVDHDLNTKQIPIPGTKEKTDSILFYAETTIYPVVITKQ
jgi:hypothetical protein